MPKKYFENEKRKPEVLKGKIVEKTKNGFWLRRIEKDEKGRLVYERERKFKVSGKPEEGIEYDYEKHFIAYDDEGNLLKEQGKSFDHESGWKKEFKYEDGKLIVEVGEVTEGPNQGHKWRKKFYYDENGQRYLLKGEILAQGINPNKEPKGHKWKEKL